jgi:putative peptidoglycan binding protein
VLAPGELLMALFDGYPTYSRYRSLSRVTPMQHGEDVYALQIALNDVISAGLVVDGVLGDKTATAIWHAQEAYGLVMDGKAGADTQRVLAQQILVSTPGEEKLPAGLAFGHIEHESSWRLGNYSVQYPNGSYDAGVVQRNTEHTPPRNGFDPVDSISALIRNTLSYYNRFSNKAVFRGSDHSERRRWALAAGSWNAPAWASYLANSRPWAVPTSAQEQTLETYMREVTTYVT